MRSENTTTGDDPSDSSPSAAPETVGQRRLDRRAVVRGAGAVFLASTLAGCYHEGGDDGGDGGGDDGGGGPYGVDDNPAPGQ